MFVHTGVFEAASRSMRLLPTATRQRFPNGEPAPYAFAGPPRRAHVARPSSSAARVRRADVDRERLGRQPRRVEERRDREVVGQVRDLQADRAATVGGSI